MFSKEGNLLRLNQHLANKLSPYWSTWWQKTTEPWWRLRKAGKRFVAGIARNLHWRSTEDLGLIKKIWIRSGGSVRDGHHENFFIPNLRSSSWRNVNESNTLLQESFLKVSGNTFKAWPQRRPRSPVKTVGVIRRLLLKSELMNRKREKEKKRWKKKMIRVGE